jgi:hypothetical protein
MALLSLRALKTYAQISSLFFSNRNFSKRRAEELTMFRRILVPLDGSKRAETILPHVEDLARRYDKSQVVLLQVVEPILARKDMAGPVSPLDPKVIERVYKNARNYLEKLQAAYHESCRRLTAWRLGGFARPDRRAVRRSILGGLLVREDFAGPSRALPPISTGLSSFWLQTRAPPRHGPDTPGRWTHFCWRSQGSSKEVELILLLYISQ